METIIDQISGDINTELAHTMQLWFNLPPRHAKSGHAILTALAANGTITEHDLSAIIDFFEVIHHKQLADKCRNVLSALHTPKREFTNN
jgi:hypothetical protein